MWDMASHNFWVKCSGLFAGETLEFLSCCTFCHVSHTYSNIDFTLTFWCRYTVQYVKKLKLFFCIFELL